MDGVLVEEKLPLYGVHNVNATALQSVCVGMCAGCQYV